MPTISYFYGIRIYLPPKTRALTEEWRMINIEALLENWQLMIESKEIKPINGLS